MKHYFMQASLMFTQVYQSQSQASINASLAHNMTNIYSPGTGAGPAATPIFSVTDPANTGIGPEDTGAVASACYHAL